MLLFSVRTCGSHKGVMVLGAPIGSPQFTADRLQIRIEEERRLWEAIPYVSDQRGWQILLQSANPRANHTLRVPPSLSREYAVAHGEGLWGTALALLGQIPGSADELSEASGRQPTGRHGPTHSP